MHEPVPIAKDKMFAKLHGAKIFSTLDLCSGYYHIGLTDAVKLKTAFVTPHGKWHFNMVPFGLAQAPLYFQQLMNQVLHGLDFAIAYLDNIIIFSNNELEHFFRSEIHYLGHMLSAEGIQPLPEKL